MDLIKNINLNLSRDKKTIVSVAIYGALLLFYCLYDFFGMVSHESAYITPFFIVSFSLMITALLFRIKIIEKIPENQLLVFIRLALSLCIVLIGFYLIERSYNTALFEMSVSYILINLFFVALLFGIVFFIGQKTKAASIVFLVFCFGLGIANYFVVTFKGQPIIPSDLFALSTAASVGSGYVYTINDNVVKALIMLAFGCLLVILIPQKKLTKTYAFINCSCALSFALVLGLWYGNTNIEEAYGCTVDPWWTTGSYSEQGLALCFLKLSQDVDPQPPTDFSVEVVNEKLSSYIPETPTAVAQELPEVSEEEKPSVIVVMNETFSDLSVYENLFDDYEGPSYYNSISDAEIKGTAYVSALGGGTCNSEFEFLTGGSMGNISGGVYPYVLYNLESSENLAAYYNALGYDTTAIHPATSTNWRRNIVYGQLGFDTFLDIEAFQESPTLRDLTTDKATYDSILDQLEQDEDPQFIFDVTIQNHSGYDTNALPESLMVSETIKGVEYPEVNEYLACIQQSDQALEYLLDELREIDRPVVLCFFGDHQPFFNDWLSEMAFDESASDFTVEQVQTRYAVPYMIWANYDLREQEKTDIMATVSSNSGSDTDKAKDTAGSNDGSTSSTDTAPIITRSDSQTTDISLNYLGSLVSLTAGLPLTSYQSYLLDLSTEMPVVNLNGYQDSEGLWYWTGEESDVSPLYEEYSAIQYESLFGVEEDKLFTHFVDSMVTVNGPLY